MSTPSILITGCSSGIGYSAAMVLKKRGYKVFATARKENDLARLAGHGLEAIKLDLNSSQSVTQCFARVIELSGGTLDALFNNGGYGQVGAIEDLSREQLRNQFETNLFGWHELTCRVITVMRKQGARAHSTKRLRFRTIRVTVTWSVHREQACLRRMD